VGQETAVTVALEFGSFARFERAPQAMGYTGLVASEHTSDTKKRQVWPAVRLRSISSGAPVIQ
jgi:hypothetical protein